MWKSNQQQFSLKNGELSYNDCCFLLSNSRYGRLGMALNNQPYVIPMSYVYSEGLIYLHSCRYGKKITIAKNNSRVCFEVDSLENGNWSSVIAFGKINLTSNLDAKHRMFDAFQIKVMQGHGNKEYKREQLSKLDMLIWEIEINEITGRKGVW